MSLALLLIFKCLHFGYARDIHKNAVWGREHRFWHLEVLHSNPGLFLTCNNIMMFIFYNSEGE